MIDLTVLSVGAPVTGSDGSVVAAVSVAVASGSRHPTAIAPLVRAAGLGISRALRAPSHPGPGRPPGPYGRIEST